MPYIKKSIPENLVKDLKDNEIYINPTGKFIIGGPDGDSGLTGRKIIVDTYGGAAPHGGGTFSEKGSTKVDSQQLMLQDICKKHCSLKNCEQMSYSIGV